MSIERRIRKLAARKVRIKITERIRSKTGFRVHLDDIDDGSFIDVPTKAQALQVLLAKLRCYQPHLLSITVRPKQK
ncbi:MAG TPA: hypothetical protein VFB72_19375 [Verrucomicrobiae bacterium]|nr:hypothetical protein [Verrucomicrobiae bacterium]